MGENGKSVCDQTFFLALARRGREPWNRWRDENPKIPVTFEHVDFRKPENASIDFSGFSFGDEATFMGCQFGDAAKFTAAAFGNHANFSDIVMGDWVDFSHATFGDYAHFDGIKFAALADFLGTHFGSKTTFASHHYPNSSGFDCTTQALFVGATFGDSTEFGGLTFLGPVFFSGAVFDHGVNFSNAVFKGRADFSGASLGQNTFFSDAVFLAPASFDISLSKTGRQFIPGLLDRINRVSADHLASQRSLSALRAQCQRLLQESDDKTKPLEDVYFSRAWFADVASFCGRSFKGSCNFGDVVFKQPPDFDDCNGAGRIDFYGAKEGFYGSIGKIPGSRVYGSKWITSRSQKRFVFGWSPSPRCARPGNAHPHPGVDDPQYRCTPTA